MQLRQLIYTNILWRGINMCSVFMLNLLISNVYGAANYGSLFYYVNALAFIVLLASFSLDASFTFYNSKPHSNTNGFTNLALLWSMGGAVVAAIVVLGYNKIVNAHFSVAHSFMYVGGMLLLTFFTALFNAKHHYVTQNLTIAIVNSGLAISLFFLKDDFNGFVKIFFITVLLQGIAMAVSYMLQYVKRASLFIINKIEFTALLQYAAIAFLGNVVFFLMYRVDYWFVDYFVKDKLLLGNYIQVSKVGQLFFIIPSIVASTVFAVTAEGKKENMQHKIIKLSKILFIGTLLLCLPLVFWGKYIFPFAFGETFTHMYRPFLLLLPGILFLATQSPISAYNGGMGKLKYNLIATIVALFLIVIGDIIFIPIWGISGAAAVCSVAYCICTIFLIITFFKTKNIAK
jgi:O-antigen/teichoic acid export membrane protein